MRRVSRLGFLGLALIALAIVRPSLPPAATVPNPQPEVRVLALAAPMPAPAVAVEPMLRIVAHRGDLDRFPENTAEAIWAAAELGVDGIEMDVHRSADGTWYVIHDPTLERTTDGSGAIADLDDAQIRAATVNGGIGYRPKAHRDLRVPRLAAVLEGLHGYSGRIYLDVKHAIGGDPLEAIELADGWPLTILCRTEAEARAIEAVQPEVETVLLWDGARGADADGWLMEAARQATAGRVASASLPVTTFVNERYVKVSEIPLLERAWKLGLRAFITKHPAAALAARDRLAQLRLARGG